MGLQGRRRGREGEALSPLLIAAAVLGTTNVIAFVVFGVDKWLARLEWRRVSERTLIVLAALGAGPGAWLAMELFRHKTQKTKFRYGVPLLALVQVGLAVLAYSLSNR